MSFSLGIIGLPNVGKSTLFHALTKKKVDTSNYPFCTIDPNVGVVAVPDERLKAIHKITQSEKTIPTTIEFVDIAGLVKGAAKGEGLGNKFLQHIREVDALIEVIRTFANKNVSHVHGSLDPDNDRQIIKLELILADLEVAARRHSKLKLQLKGPANKELTAEYELLAKVITHLKKELPLHRLDLNYEEKALLKPFSFLTLKPTLYVYNISEEEVKDIGKIASNELKICAKLESELADIPDQDLPMYLKELGLEESGLNQLIKKSYKLLNLMTFFTFNAKETRAWTIAKKTKASQAAGIIHTDFSRGFIRAEVVDWKILSNHKSWTEVRDLGKVKTEGKKYTVQDGDVVYFHVN